MSSGTWYPSASWITSFRKSPDGASDHAAHYGLVLTTAVFDFSILTRPQSAVSAGLGHGWMAGPQPASRVARVVLTRSFLADKPSLGDISLYARLRASQRPPVAVSFFPASDTTIRLVHLPLPAITEPLEALCAMSSCGMRLDQIASQAAVSRLILCVSLIAIDYHLSLVPSSYHGPICRVEWPCPCK